MTRYNDRLLLEYLEEGPTELPGRSYDGVRAGIQNVRQRAVIGPWKEPNMNRYWIIGAIAAALVVFAVIASPLLRPPDNNIGGQSTATPNVTATPIPSVPSTAFPTEGPPLDEGRQPIASGEPVAANLLGQKFNQADDPPDPTQNLVLTLRPVSDPHCSLMFQGDSTCFTILWEPNLPGLHHNDPGARGSAVMRDGQLVLGIEIVPNDRACEGKEVVYEISSDGSTLTLVGTDPACSFETFERV